jgi:hypothetical protein
MKSLLVGGGLLLGMVLIACSSDPLVGCEETAECLANEDLNCPGGIEDLFCNFAKGGICDCREGSGGTGGSDGTGGTDGAGGTGSCVLDDECNPFEIYDCDTPCRAFCGSSGTEAYGSCGSTVDPPMPPYYCICHCNNVQCP